MKATKLLESAEDFTHLNRFSDKLKDSLKDLDRHIDYLEGQLEDVKKARKDNAPGMDYVEKLNKDALRVCARNGERTSWIASTMTPICPGMRLNTGKSNLQNKNTPLPQTRE